MNTSVTVVVAAFTVLSLAAAQDGAQIYTQAGCVGCHGAEGEGGTGPALAGNANLESAEYHISRILNGGAGMPAFRDQLSDAEIAAVTNHERMSWGNSFSEVSAQEVAQVRAGQGSSGASGEAQSGGSESGGAQAGGAQSGGDQATSQSGQVSISTEVVAEGLVSPVQLTAPDGDKRRFVVDRVGKIYILNANNERLETPFLDLGDKIVELQEDFDERGLLGLAFHPNYADNGHFYVYYSAPLRESAPQNWDHTSHVSEFTVLTDKPDQADPASERVLLEVDQPQFNHNGGALAFGPDDGYLYIALGDGGAADDVALGHPPMGHGQDVTSLLGNVLRIDVDRGWPGYAVPQDNPLVGKEGHDEIYSWGWRNPWRMSFDRGGDHGLYVATNGQNLWEAVYQASGPGNYGWNMLEGTHCFDPQRPNEAPESCPRVGANGEPLHQPVIEYPHLANQGDSPVAGASVIGGYVYRGAALPGLQGRYVFGDWSSDFAEPKGQLLMASVPNAPGALWSLEQVAQLDAYVLGFGEDSSGELYALTTDATGPTGTTGKVHKIVAGE